MARYRRRRRHSNEAALFVVVAIAMVLVGARIIGIAERHIGTIVALAATVLAGAVVGVALRLRHRREVREVEQTRLIEALRHNEMNPRQFEHALAALCERDGCTDVRVVGGAGDLGADVIARSPQNRHIVLQAKRYRADKSVGSMDLQRFGGTCFTIHRADVAAMVTTAGGFTAQARDYAAQMNIRLIDGRALAAWASRTGPAPWQ